MNMENITGNSQQDFFDGVNGRGTFIDDSGHGTFIGDSHQGIVDGGSPLRKRYIQLKKGR